MVDEAILAEASGEELHLPMHVRRTGSAAKIHDTSTTSVKAEESIIAVELLKVKCRVGAATEPHQVEDMEYDWSYNLLEEDLQLSIGLGKSLRPAKSKGAQDLAEDGDLTDHTWDSRSGADDDSGLGGF